MGIAALFAPLSQALVIDLDYEFSGGTDPAGSTPWLTATFEQYLLDPNSIVLTLDAFNLVGTEYIMDVYLNLDPTLNPLDLTITQDPVGPQATAISRGVNAFKADGDGYYDVKFDFVQSGSGDRFGSGETAQFLITNTTGALSPDDFAFFDFGGSKGNWVVAAHVGSIDPGGKSGWIAGDGGMPGGGPLDPGPGPSPVPEPTTLLLFGMGTSILISRKKSLL